MAEGENTLASVDTHLSEWHTTHSSYTWGHVAALIQINTHSQAVMERPLFTAAQNLGKTLCNKVRQASGYAHNRTAFLWHKGFFFCMRAGLPSVNAITEKTLCLMEEPKITPPLVKLNLYICLQSFWVRCRFRAHWAGERWWHGEWVARVTHKSAAQNSHNEPLFYGSTQAYRCLNLMESVGALKYVYEKLDPLDLLHTECVF